MSGSGMARRVVTALGLLTMGPGQVAGSHLLPRVTLNPLRVPSCTSLQVSGLGGLYNHMRCESRMI